MAVLENVAARVYVTSWIFVINIRSVRTKTTNSRCCLIIGEFWL